MVTNRDRKSFGPRRKNAKICSEAWQVDVFDLRSGNSGPTSQRASVCPNLHDCWIQPAQVKSPFAQLLI